jgi:putative DNA primase/helicase
MAAPPTILGLGRERSRETIGLYAAQREGNRADLVRSYEVKDAEGRLVAIHHRRDLPDGGKRVWWSRPDGETGLNGTPLGDLPLYGSQLVAGWSMDDPVVLTEGEKATDALLSTGYVNAVGTVTGAAKEPGPEALEVLRDRWVILWPDEDEQGREHMRRIAGALQGIAAATCWYEWEDAPEKGDAADHPAVRDRDERGLDALLDDLMGAPTWVPREAEPEDVAGGDAGAQEEWTLTDTGNAERLIARHGADLRYCWPWGKWLVWDGARWRPDDTGEVYRRAKETVRSIYAEAADAGDSAMRKALADHAKSSESRHRIEAMVDLARSAEGVPVLPQDLDNSPWLLNVPNGTVDLRTGELRKHRRDDLLTKLAGAEYHPDAEAPTFDAFLRRVLPSEPVRAFVQRVVGYAITGDVSEQVLPFLWGGGANGKSTFINTVLSACGDYGMQAAPDLLLAKRTAHPTELADLFGARFVASVEVEDGRRFAESLVKQLTGGDRIKARYMRQDFFEFDPTHKVFLVANHKPEVRGTDHAIWRRIKLVPFDVTIPKAEQDPRLPELLRAELPGILAWMVAGCLDWRREGLGEPEEVSKATAEYRAEQDVLAAFITDRCVVRPGAMAQASDLYSAYKQWCADAGEEPVKQRAFGMSLTERRFKRTPRNGRTWYEGIGLRTDRPDPDTPEGGPEGGPGDNPQPRVEVDQQARTIGQQRLQEGANGADAADLVDDEPQSSTAQTSCKPADSEEVGRGCRPSLHINEENRSRIAVMRKQGLHHLLSLPRPVVEGSGGVVGERKARALEAFGASGSGAAKNLRLFLAGELTSVEYLVRSVRVWLGEDPDGWEGWREPVLLAAHEICADGGQSPERSAS